MIGDTAAGVARAAAGELSPRYGPELAADVETAIYEDGRHQVAERTPPDQFVDPIALGALIVSITQLGYQIYSDHKKKGQPPTREVIARVIRIERRKHGDLTAEEAEIIDMVSGIIIERGDNELPRLEIPR